LKLVAVGVARCAAVQVNGVAGGDGLVGAGIGYRFGIFGIDDNGADGAVLVAVIDDKADNIASCAVDDKAGFGRGEVVQCRDTIIGTRGECPAIGDGIAFGIGRAGAIKQDFSAHRNTLIGTGFGNGRVIVGKTPFEIGRIERFGSVLANGIGILAGEGLARRQVAEIDVGVNDLRGGTEADQMAFDLLYGSIANIYSARSKYRFPVALKYCKNAQTN